MAYTYCYLLFETYCYLPLFCYLPLQPTAISYLKSTATHHTVLNLLLSTMYLYPNNTYHTLCYLLFETYCYLSLFCYLPLQPTAIYYLKPTVTYRISINRLLPTIYVNPTNIYHILENLLQPFI